MIVVWLAIIIIAAGTGILLFIIGNLVDKKNAYPLATPPVTGTPDTPTPAPAAAPRRSYGWLVWLVAIALLAGLGWLGYQSLQPKSKSAHQTSTPKRELQKQIVCRPIEFAGGKEAMIKRNIVGTRKGGYAEFEINNFPFRKDGRYQVVFQIICNSTAEHHLEIEGWPETFHFRHRKIGQPEMVVFFGEVKGGRVGESKFFHPGKVRFKLWSDDDILVLSSHVELIYHE